MTAFKYLLGLYPNKDTLFSGAETENQGEKARYGVC